MSVKPVPTGTIVGEADLAAIRSIGYANLERWSQLLLGQCRVVDSVIDPLTANAALTSEITLTNTQVTVAARCFEGRTNPSFVFTIQDPKAGSVSEADVNVISNALGYAQTFFEHVGTIDEALFSGLFAGFTQIQLPDSTPNNSMLFLRPAVGKRQFMSGLSAAAADAPARRTHRSRTTVRRQPTRRVSRFRSMTGSRLRTEISI